MTLTTQRHDHYYMEILNRCVELHPDGYMLVEGAWIEGGTPLLPSVILKKKNTLDRISWTGVIMKWIHGKPFLKGFCTV